MLLLLVRRRPIFQVCGWRSTIVIRFAIRLSLKQLSQPTPTPLYYSRMHRSKQAVFDFQE